jgi:hypothetical protein
MGTAWPFDAQAGPDTVPVPEKEGWPDEFRAPLIVTVKLPPTLKLSVTWLDELIVPVRERIQLSVLHVSPRKSTARRAVGRHHCARTGVSRIRVVTRIRRDHNDPGHVSREC